MPDLKLAIEYNGIYWHSIKRGCDKYTHRNKSIACKQLNIRLVHIFEFEDLNEQLYKLNQLIKGIDLFEKTFTKNNLIEVPKTEPIAIYHDSLHTVFGA